MNPTLKPSHIALLAGGALTFIASFFAFVSVDFGFDDVTRSAWSGDAGSPLSTFPAIIGLILAGATAAALFGNVKLPDNVLGFTWPQWTYILSFAALLIMVGWLFANDNKGFGFWLMLLGTIAYFAGSVMEVLGLEPGKTSTPGQGPGNTPPSPF